MENFIRPPNPLKDNMPKTWTIWKEEFLIFMGLIGYLDRSQTFKANIFKNLIGTVGLETISKLSFDSIEDKDNLDILIKKIDNYYNPQQTEIQKRYKFFSSAMKSNETIENYIQSLKEKAKECDFGYLTTSLIRDVVILHTNNKALRQKYLQKENLNCDMIIEIYKNYKIQENENKLKSSNDQSVEKTTNKKINKQKEHTNVTYKQKEHTNVTYKQKSCWRCQSHHPMGKCPAWNHKCTKCNMLNHFERCCQHENSNSQCIPNNINMNNLNLNKEKFAKDSKTFFNYPK